MENGFLRLIFFYFLLIKQCRIKKIVLTFCILILQFFFFLNKKNQKTNLLQTARPMHIGVFEPSQNDFFVYVDSKLNKGFKNEHFKEKGRNSNYKKLVRENWNSLGTFKL